MPTSHNRFLIELDAARREINREVISPRIGKLSVETMKPALRAVAHARQAYVSAFMKVADSADPAPSRGLIAALKDKREAYEELVRAANALEQVIQKDYVDVSGTSG